MNALIKCLAAVSVLAVSATTLAHKQSDSYLTLSVEGSVVSGQWDIALRDLDYAIGLDLDADNQITWSEVRTQRAAIQTYAFERLQIASSPSVCPIRSDDLLIDEHVDGAYAVLRFAAVCSGSPHLINVRYGLSSRAVATACRWYDSQCGICAEFADCLV
jgi:hypothetical protein